MLTITDTEVHGFRPAIRGMRNPMESHHRSDSSYTIQKYSNDTWETPSPYWYSETCHIGPNDKKLMMNLAKSGPEHAKYRRMIVVYCDILGPLYWWKDFDTYAIGVVKNGYSTMHGIHRHEFSIDMFSNEHLLHESKCVLREVISILNKYRELFLATNEPVKKHLYWYQMIQLLPSSYNQKRTVMTNYQVLSEVYRQRINHKDSQWREDLCAWIEKLPNSWIITGKDGDNG